MRRSVVHRSLLVTLLVALLPVGPLATLAPRSADASPLTVGDCRAGVTTTTNGSYTAGGVTIEPVYSKRLYLDVARGFDANYVAYRVKNEGGTALEDLWVQLDTFGAELGPTVVTLANPSDDRRQIPTLAGGAATTVYFLLRATGTSTNVQTHRVLVHDGFPGAGTIRAACTAGVDGVQRSLAASANKVTSITPSGTPSVGGTITVTVEGVTGNVGSGTSTPDLSVFAYSPATSSRWPVRSLRLESVRIDLRDIGPQSTCTGANSTGGSGAGQTASYLDTLVIRAFSACARSTKSKYTAVATFRVLAPSTDDPVFRPVASIASGTQVKYTGSYPAETTAIPLSGTTVPVAVVKSLRGDMPVRAVAGGIEVDYRVTASVTGGAAGPLVLDAVLDDHTAGMSLLAGATFTDAPRSTATSATALTESATRLRFVGPYTITDVAPLALDYTMRITLPDPLPGGELTYQNLAVALSGGYAIGSGGNITGITVTRAEGGTLTTAETTVSRPKDPQTITFTPPPTIGAGATITLDAYSDSGLPVTFESLTPETCTVSEFAGVWTLTAVAEGPCRIEAEQDGNASFLEATTERTIDVQRGQTITAAATPSSFSTPPGSGTVTVSATSTLEVLLASIDTSRCTVGTGGTPDATTGAITYPFTVLTAGSCVLVATQGGGTVGTGDSAVTWGPAPDREVVIGTGAAQVIDFPTIADRSASPTSFTVSATSRPAGSSTGTTKLPVTFATSTPGVCTFTDPAYNSTSGVTTTTVTASTPGTCSLTTTQDGTNDDGDPSSYAPAEPVTRTFSVTGGGAGKQTVHFGTLSDRTYGDANFTISATSREGEDDPAGTPTELLVTFAVEPSAAAVCAVGPATLQVGGASHATVAISASGECAIRATQLGSGAFAPAPAVVRTFTVDPRGVTAALTATRPYDGTLVLDPATYTGSTLLGVLPADAAQVTLAGSPSATLPVATPGAGVRVGLPVTGVTLAGARAEQYTLDGATVEATITPRAITIAPQDVTLPGSEAAGGGSWSACTIAVTSGSLASGDTLAADCATVTFADGTSTYPITIIEGSVVITRDGSGGAAGDATADYLVSRAAAVLTVSDLLQPTITAEPLVIVYGDDLTVAIGAAPPAASDGPGAGAQELTGTFEHRFAGEPVDRNTRIPVGSATLQLAFTPDGASAGTHGPRTVTRTVTVQPRRLTVSGLSITERVYDGTADVTVDLAGAVLIADPTGGTGGVLDGDAVSISLATFAATSSGTDVGTHDVTVSGLTLAGPDAGNYLLRQPTPNRTIVPRPVDLTAADATMLLDVDAEPAHTATAAGLMAGADASLLGAFTVGRTDPSAPLTVGALTLLPSAPAGGWSSNFAVTARPGTLYVAAARFGVEETPGGPLTSRDVTCTCEGLLPGSPVTLRILSTPTVLATGTIDDDGECPDLTATIPAAVEDGPHTLELLGTFPDGSDLRATRPVLLDTPTGPQGVTPAPPAGPPTVDDAPDDVPPAPGPVSGGTTDRGPRGPGGSAAGPAGDGGAGGVTEGAPDGPGTRRDPNEDAPGGTDAAPVEPGAPGAPGTTDGAPFLPAGPADTVDAGDGRPLTLRDGATLAEVIAATREWSARRLDELAGERLSGFAPGSGIRIEVIGARTTARFVLSRTEVIDAAVLVRALEASMPAQAVDFARLDGLAPTSAPSELPAWDPQQRAAAEDLFTASRLATPRVLADLDIPADATWIALRLTVASYLPGSVVHLTVTSDPIVLASATVGRDGTVVLDGALPVEVLPAGEHRIRVVGTRVFDGIAVDTTGDIVLPERVLDEIARFDLRTDATVRVVGLNGQGGAHVALRIVPLDPRAPWWTLWFVALATVATVWARRRGRIEGRGRRLGAAGAILLSALPAIVLGWRATTTEVAWWGLGAALIGIVLSAAIRRAAEDADEDVDTAARIS